MGWRASLPWARLHVRHDVSSCQAARSEQARATQASYLCAHCRGYTLFGATLTEVVDEIKSLNFLLCTCGAQHSRSAAGRASTRARGPLERVVRCLSDRDPRRSPARQRFPAFRLSHVASMALRAA